MPSHRWYAPVDAAMLRAATVADAFVPPSPWPNVDQDASREEMCQWIAKVWSDTQIADAVRIASPSLADRIDGICAGGRPPRAQSRRALLALACYLLRMRGRSTPFGLFAGVTSLRWDQDPIARWEPDRHWIRTRAHSVWLSAVISELETHPELARRLPLVLNDLAFERAGRLVIPWQPHATDPARPPAGEISPSITSAVRLVIDHAHTHLTTDDLTGKISAELNAPSDAVEELLRHLIAAGVLITSLRPPSTCRDCLAHLRDRLAEADAVSIPDLQPLLCDLEQIAAQLAEGRIETGVRMRELAAVEHPVTVDLRVGATVVLPLQIADEAAAAASALARLTPHPSGDPGWRVYHDAFLSRFGVNAIVPVTELVDPVTGLGYPDHFAAPAVDLPRELTARDARLLALAQQAGLDGAREVELDDAFIDGLHDDAVSLRIPPHLELFTQLWAPDTTAVRSGDFRLVISGVARTGTALSGRFIDLLPEADQRHRRTVYTGLPTVVEGAVAAQLSFPPVHAHLENVARAPQLLPSLVTLAEHRMGATARFPLEDLAVTADSRGMYLISLSQGRVVEPMLANAAARHVMPSMARFLFEISRARIASSSPFAWGAARCLPFLPRITYGRTILSTARWSISPAALPRPDLSDAQWRKEFETLRHRLRLPDTVSIGDSDLRFRLNLDEPMDLAILRDCLDRAGATGHTTVVAEGSTPADHGWFDGRAHELVIPVASTRPAGPAPRATARSAGPVIIRRGHGLLPGSGHILLAKLYTDPSVFDTILVQHLPELLHQWLTPPSWWFVRYRDPHPHLRLRLHAGDQADAFTKVSAWATDLRNQGLIRSLVFDTHLPEVARYGDGEAQVAAERLFAADSMAVLAQLATLQQGRNVHALSLIAAGMADLVGGLSGGRTAGMEWLINYGDLGAGDRPDRDIVRQAVQLAEPGAIIDLRGGTVIADTWARRADAAADYSRYLADRQSEAAGTIRSLLHMHHIRFIGIDPASERTCHRLARAIALAWTSRHREVHP
ncbi:thiopeptide-type bacteriocin biosynthesis domain-containing protein [Sinosporangium album]|uniref:Thiopeptide-type bacteriocin biosynthesis domain-containing protein n=1 Tax=Sinosporangium album TaxID=504805 RepID=A0A1G7WTK0_9ACTN|nr:lantibiotic dehydratase [Sinosporangium album]SDG75258.1 thiopeptide-type bacteriocin biosynthesis domain-containing protein [Sinosporangium album]